MGIKDRINKVFQTNNSKMKANLKKHKIEIKLEGRNVEFSEEGNMSELKQK